MTQPFKQLTLLFTLVLFSNFGFSQCADSSNIYSFVYGGHSYDVVKENKTWTEASNCAVSLNGYLAEISDTAEQVAIFNELTTNAGIVIANTENQFGTASVWLGGSDAVTEGEWIWDGDNDGLGSQFWSGGPSGMAIGGSFTHWGTSPAEPDNSGGQDYLTIIIKPTAVNYGLWNDLISTNTIYYLVEYDFVASTTALEQSTFKIYPNPFQDVITIEHSTPIAQIAIYDLVGQLVMSVSPSDIDGSTIDLSGLSRGSYILNVGFENGQEMSQQINK